MITVNLANWDSYVEDTATWMLGELAKRERGKRGPRISTLIEKTAAHLEEDGLTSLQSKAVSTCALNHLGKRVLIWITSTGCVRVSERGEQVINETTLAPVSARVG